MAPKPLSILALAGASVALALASDSLTDDELKLLQDPGGWEYITVSDEDAGIQTQHVCFDGQPHPRECSGKLTLRSDNTFTQQVTIHGQNVDRHGTYELDNDQIAFFDEFGTRDGPYSLQLNAESKRLVLSMPQVRLDLELESQYKDDLRQKKAPAANRD
jgi:hypothetical protein